MTSERVFIDASAIVAIVAGEPGHEQLAEKALAARSRMTSAISVWEAAQALERLRPAGDWPGMALVSNLLATTRVEVVDVTLQIGIEAHEAALRYGKGRHPARLNMGDCFAYACAKVLGVPLLYKGGDFALTDIEPA